MRFSEEFETRFAEMLTHYPTKRSALVPTLLYAQDEVGNLSDEAIAELARRMDLTELEVRNVIRPRMDCSRWKRSSVLARAAGLRQYR